MSDDIDELLDEFEQLERQATAAEAALDGLAESDAEAVADAYRRANSLLTDYRDRATGSGDFGGYMEFRSRFSSLVEDLDAGLARRDAFEAALEHVERRRLSGSDFDRAEAALAPARTITETLTELQTIRDTRASVRSDLLDARAALEARRSHLESLAEISPEALDVPIDSLRMPIERYNEAIETEHRALLKETPSRDLLALYRRLSYFALIGVESPPEALQSYLERHDVGDKPIPTIREYLSYSRSKLDHYVADAGRFLGELAPHSGYLESLSPEPFRIEWPPPARDRFEWQLRDLIQATGRFAGDEAVELLRELQSLCRDSERYTELRSAARLREELDNDERQLVLTGGVDNELDAVSTQIAAIDAALDQSG